MRTRSGFLALATTLVAAFTLAPSAHAAHHLWNFSEIFSNASGSVQYVELFCTDANEQGVGPFTITSNAHTFNFVTNLPNTATANTYILVATSGFGSLAGGVTPDYIIPSNFFATGGGTLNYASGVQVWSYGAVPTDGTHSLLRNGSTAINSPTNYAGQGGSVNLATAVPMLPRWGLVLVMGALLLAGSGILARRPRTTV
jgi:hypothetical protein